MPLKHLRICVPCDQTRYAPCSIGCRVPDEQDPENWTTVEDNAATLSAPNTQAATTP